MRKIYIKKEIFNSEEFQKEFNKNKDKTIDGTERLVIDSTKPVEVGSNIRTGIYWTEKHDFHTPGKIAAVITSITTEDLEENYVLVRCDK